MDNFTIYHNPRCSKSRKTLELLKEKGIEPNIVLYLENLLTTDNISNLLALLNMEPRELLRSSEAEYKELGLKDKNITNGKLIEIMSKHPKLIERPIVVNKQRAVIGRPPENILELIK
tara:strand:+ start:4358 stop:4711 length:354 start_codon:yes stop_codon:yes gene_type:complete